MPSGFPGTITIPKSAPKIDGSVNSNLGAASYFQAIVTGSITLGGVITLGRRDRDHGAVREAQPVRPSARASRIQGAVSTNIAYLGAALRLDRPRPSTRTATRTAAVRHQSRRDRPGELALDSNGEPRRRSSTAASCSTSISSSTPAAPHRPAPPSTRSTRSSTRSRRTARRARPASRPTDPGSPNTGPYCASSRGRSAGLGQPILIGDVDDRPGSSSWSSAGRCHWSRPRRSRRHFTSLQPEPASSSLQMTPRRRSRSSGIGGLAFAAGFQIDQNGLSIYGRSSTSAATSATTSVSTSARRVLRRSHLTHTPSASVNG